MSIYLGNTPLANTGYDKANTSLSNLTSTGKNIANWSNNVTNCITEIPQDIKLELNNGTLTLKAGSKVYVPNGVGVFDVVTTSSDLTLTQTENGLYLITVTSNGLYFVSAPVDRYSSGSSDSLSGQTYHTWYDTTNNLIKRYRSSGSTVDHYESFPIALVTVTNGAISSIDQVFNGFGYIGSTVFALPGVKGLIPDGRNDDGTLKSIEFTVGSVLVSQGLSGDSAEYAILNTNSLYTYNSAFSAPTSGKVFYDEKQNKVYVGTSSSGHLIACSISCPNSKIDNITIPKTFRALNWSDSSTISGWSMPSSRYIDLTLGASGSTYTAPANGYVAVSKMTTAQNQNISINCNNFRSFAWGHAASINIFTWMPVNKGDVFSVTYSAGGTHTDNYFRFIYAEGEN